MFLNNFRGKMIPTVEICYANESAVPLIDDAQYSVSYILSTQNALIVNVIIPIVLFLLYYLFGVSLHVCMKRKIVTMSENTTTKTVKEFRKNTVRPKSCINMKISPHKPLGQLDHNDMKKILYTESKEGQESESEYEIGGYMPLSPGEILENHYRVCRKLGYGHFSTVWLCENLRSSPSDPKYVAIKISKSDKAFAAVADDEIKLLEDTRRFDPNHRGYKHIVQMVDTFKVASINGMHTAIALEIMGPSLLHLLIQSEFRGIQVSSVKKIIQQVLLGLTYLHETCLIIHTDIKPENILIKVKESYIQEMISKVDQFARFGLPMPRSYVGAADWQEPDNPDVADDLSSKEEEKRSKSYPFDVFLADLCKVKERRAQPYLTEPMWVNANIEIKIADLGNACWEYRHFAAEIQTRQYRALEVILGAGYSFPADVWSVGCLAFEMATGEMLFCPKGRSNLEVNVDHLSLIWETLGGIPQYVTESGTDAKTYFSKGKLLHVQDDELRVWKIEDVLVEKYKWKRVDAIPLAGFIECLVEPDPTLRKTARQALTLDWLNES